jgi:sugar phosphate isomerase/epimerase
MKIGLEIGTIAHRGLEAGAVLALAQDRKLDGVQFPDPTAIDAALDERRLAAFRAEADERGLYVEVGVMSPNPVLRARREGRDVEVAEHARDLYRQLEAAAAIGCTFVGTHIGERRDRFRPEVPWSEQVAAARAVLARVAPAARELGLRVAIENHADLSADELLALVEALGTDVAGVMLDTGNLPLRLDDPLAATAQLAPLVLSAHLSDAVLAFTPRGLSWQARPVGSGILPIPDLLDLLRAARPDINLSVEVQPGSCDLPIFDPAWLRSFPDLRAADLAGVVALAAACERRFAEGSLARPEPVDPASWADLDNDWIARSVGYLRPIVELLETL